MVFSEKDMEDAISQNPEKYIGETGLKLISRQYRIGSYIFDLLFEDRHGAKFIVEVQKGVLDRIHTYKILDYYHEFKENNPTEFIELMAVANRITHERKKRLSDWGVSYKEIPESEFINTSNSLIEIDTSYQYFITQKEEKEYNRVAGYYGSIEELKKAYAEYSDKELACLLLKILDWAAREGIFLTSPGKNPNFRLRGKSQQGLVTFHYNGLIQIYLTNLESKAEKISMLDEIMKINPLLKYDNPNKIRGSKDLSKKVQELSEAELDEILLIFLKYCD